MFEFLFTCSLLLSLAGLSIALYTLVGTHFHDTRTGNAPRYAATGLDVYGQNLVATYLGYRQ